MAGAERRGLRVPVIICECFKRSLNALVNGQPTRLEYLCHCHCRRYGNAEGTELDFTVFRQEPLGQVDVAHRLPRAGYQNPANRRLSLYVMGQTALRALATKISRL